RTMLETQPEYLPSSLLIARQRIFFRLQVAPKSLQEINGCCQAAEAVFAEKPSQQTKEPDWFFPLRGGFGDAFRNCLKDALEPFRLDASKNAPPEEQISNSANGLRSFGVVHHF